MLNYTWKWGGKVNIIVAVDDKNGMLFNHRRVSKDKEVRKKIAEIVQGNKLWMSQYSVSQYQDESYPFYVDDNFLFKAAKEEYCFVEDRGLSDVKECIDGMIIFGGTGHIHQILSWIYCQKIADLFVCIQKILLAIRMIK